MKHIQDYVDLINDELNGAKTYAENYLRHKAKGNNNIWAQRFREMSENEIQHAIYLHEMANTEIEELSRYYTPPVEMAEEWEETHRRYVEKVAWIKQMLSM